MTLLRRRHFSPDPDIQRRLAAISRRHLDEWGHRPEDGICTDACLPPSPPGPFDCPICCDAGFVRLTVSRDDPRFGRAVPCECASEPLTIRIPRILRASGAPKAALDRCTWSALASGSEPSRSLYHWLTERAGKTTVTLYSERSGQGKTHSAIAALNSWARMGRSVYFLTAADYVERLRREATAGRDESVGDAGTDGDGDEPPRRTGHLPTQALLAARSLVVLDDLGAERLTAFAEEQLVRLVDSRQLAGAALIITCNREPDAERDAHSRLWRRVFDSSNLLIRAVRPG